MAKQSQAKGKTENQKQPSKKKGINGRNKGAGFERVVAKTLCVWWLEEFHRTPASGGLHWAKDQRVSGDIVPPEGSDFPFSVECKKVEGWNFEQILKDVGEPKSWWAQCTRDAEESGKIPLLLFSKNFSPVYYAMPSSIWEKLSIKGNFFLTFINGDEVVIGELDRLTEKSKEDILEKLSNN